jgi:prefoldin alpha subunit
MNQEELNKKFMQFEQQIRQIQEQLGAVEQAIMDMSQIKMGLDEIKGKKGEEIMAPIGRGVYIKAKLLSEELTVDVGGKNFVGKSVDETKKLIEEQIEKLKNIKGELEMELEKINQEITAVMMEHEQSQKK